MIIAAHREERGPAQVLNELSSGTWVNVVAPASDESSRLESDLHVPRAFVAALDVDERARTVGEEQAHLILLRVPVRRDDCAHILFSTLPLGVVLTDEIMVTVSQQESEVIHDLLAGRARARSTARRNRLLRPSVAPGWREMRGPVEMCARGRNLPQADKPDPEAVRYALAPDGRPTGESGGSRP